ncbi:MAG: PH domain-containing protein [Jatrophihabitans sp.]|uniref:PH domain-containing protein n=1 Tax=Jatrophihabitans sp. TaxID=1932789 RepID=UPI003915EDAB
MPAFLPSELPVRASTRHHWIVLLRPPSKVFAVAMLVLLLAAIAKPNPMTWFFLLLLVSLGFLRWQTWRAERIILTGKRIIRVQGVPETTSTEASLRVDRISGARLVETVPGKILGYGTIELEAPGDHPGVRRLRRIAQPKNFYLQLRGVLLGEPHRPDPDDGLIDGEYITEPLPYLPTAPYSRTDRNPFVRRRG